MRDQYIPDMTERFPEGLDGPDYTDSYFGGGSYSDEDLAWNSMENEYEDYIQEIIDNIQSYSDEQLQNMYDEEREGFGDDVNIEDFNGTTGYRLMKAIEQEWDRRQAEREAATKSYFIAWYDSLKGDDYDIFEASDLDEAIEFAKANYGNDLEDVQPYNP